MKEIINNVFLDTIKSYEKILSNYYPAHNSNGFTERNLTFNFSHNYLLKNNEAIIWQECPLKEGKHFDTLIIDDQKKTIIVIEAKRLQSENKLNQVKADYERIIEHFGEINLDEKRQSYSKYGLLLVDIWISIKNEKNDKRNKLLERLNFELKAGNSFERNVIDINYEEYNENYSLSYKLFSIEE